ncbi:uncharacterized protein N7483_003618 [Penicillium malachiteum]|uniref:uncharacterized protein n=1 Tax=Penicillium malachiteum TaxID=1324776 RepID=UPI0025470902|nr:uncharacterized protein N7483_003618 [Penicillium malachiteum]KAJ5729110.1 hypothetical protein N7483_003618 [Penicillium malachiteum]
MAVTAFPSTGDSPDLTLLNTARLFTRLEHNLLSPGSELRTLHGSEFQRMRITKNVDYARTLLSQLERSLSQLKSPEHRHEAQAEIARDRNLLKRMQIVLDEESSRTEENDIDTESGEWDDLFSKPVTMEKVTPSTKGSQTQSLEEKRDITTTKPATVTSVPASVPASAPTTTVSPTSTLPPTSTPTSTLRNRSTANQSPESNNTSTAKASGSNANPNSKLNTTEQALSSHRLEQEDLTSSLLSLAGQLKASSQSFQATLENEQSVLDRAVTGMDKTTATMEAAGKRMGMIRKMSEGKGWWGRMMLYAWIFGLWIVAILIVYVGPKLRF